MVLVDCFCVYLYNQRFIVKKVVTNNGKFTKIINNIMPTQALLIWWFKIKLLATESVSDMRLCF